MDMLGEHILKLSETYRNSIITMKILNESYHNLHNQKINNLNKLNSLKSNIRILNSKIKKTASSDSIIHNIHIFSKYKKDLINLETSIKCSETKEKDINQKIQDQKLIIEENRINLYKAVNEWKSS